MGRRDHSCWPGSGRQRHARRRSPLLLLLLGLLHLHGRLSVVLGHDQVPKIDPFGPVDHAQTSARSGYGGRLLLMPRPASRVKRLARDGAARGDGLVGTHCRTTAAGVKRRTRHRHHALAPLLLLLVVVVLLRGRGLRRGHVACLLGASWLGEGGQLVSGRGRGWRHRLVCEGLLVGGRRSEAIDSRPHSDLLLRTLLLLLHRRVEGRHGVASRGLIRRRLILDRWRATRQRCAGDAFLGGDAAKVPTVRPLGGGCGIGAKLLLLGEHRCLTGELLLRLGELQIRRQLGLSRLELVYLSDSLHQLRLHR
mmetsp:Transcript_13827/g.39833  ORF Transcript_13827/g.39833 Transcript_13827/m.39833 type:complete len:309 (+) Transcript_13827:359-1285(+)